MKIIKDERLVIQNLKNIRIAFIFQSLCIIGILVNDGLHHGVLHVQENPLWLVMMGTVVILGYLNLRISIDQYETHNMKKQAPYYKNVIIALAIGIIFGIIALLAPGGSVKDAVVLGGVLFLCFLFSYSVVYFLRKKQQDDDE